MRWHIVCLLLEEKGVQILQNIFLQLPAECGRQNNEGWEWTASLSFDEKASRKAGIEKVTIETRVRQNLNLSGEWFVDIGSDKNFCHFQFHAPSADIYLSSFEYIFGLLRNH